MHKTKHLYQRISQRGIRQNMLDLVYCYGEVRGDKVFLNKKIACKLLDRFRKDKQTALKAMHRGIDVFNGEKTFTLGRNEAKVFLRNIDARIKDLMKIIDKGGITLIESDNTLITAYNNY